MTTNDPQFNSLFPAASCSRRGFVVSTLCAGFALAVRPVVAQSVITTDGAGLTAGEIRVPTQD